MTETSKSAKKPNKKDEVAKVASRSSEDRADPRIREFRVTRDLLINKGPLHVPESIRRPGYAYFWMRAEKYRIDKYRKLGYDFAYDSKGEVVRGGDRDNAMFLLDIPIEIKDQLEELKQDLRKEETLRRNQELVPADNESGVYQKSFSHEKKAL